MRDSELNPRYPSQTSWPALLARHLNLPYECYACPGVGNLQITNEILNHTAEPAVFVINWTFIDRFDYGDPNDERPHLTNWHTIMPGDAAEVADFYYRNLHSEYRDKLTALINIKLCIDTLNQAGQRFIMTAVDDLLFDTRWHQSPGIALLQAAIRPAIQTFAGANMIEYARQRGHALGAKNHPLEAAHRDLFSYALDNFGIDKV